MPKPSDVWQLVCHVLSPPPISSADFDPMCHAVVEEAIERIGSGSTSSDDLKAHIEFVRHFAVELLPWVDLAKHDLETRELRQMWDTRSEPPSLPWVEYRRGLHFRVDQPKLDLIEATSRYRLYLEHHEKRRSSNPKEWWKKGILASPIEFWSKSEHKSMFGTLSLYAIQSLLADQAAQSSELVGVVLRRVQVCLRERLTRRSFELRAMLSFNRHLI